MAIDYERLKNWPFEEMVHSYGPKDTILYALGIGLGADPMDTDQLGFLLEDDLKALPTLPVVLAYPGAWLMSPGTGVEWRLVLHGEQGLVLHKPVPASGTIAGKTVIEEIIDKGPGKGAILYTRRDIRDHASGELIASLTSSTFCRGDGGFGGPSGPSKSVHALPDRAPDLTCDLPTSLRSALIYRLNGDHNPLHSVPAAAQKAGFPRPILHGLCTYGVAGHALLRTLCDYDPERLRSIAVRFSAPVFPGETVRTEIWREGSGRYGFRCRVVERDVVVINNGLAEIAG